MCPMRPDPYDLIRAERERQDARWGVQDHPDLDPVLTERRGGATPERHAQHLEIPTAGFSKTLCARAAEFGHTNWSVILVEELAEVVDAAARRDTAGLRDELVQVAAVAVAWLEAIDRREVRR